MNLLKYRLQDGLIVGCWSGQNEEQLTPNVVQSDAEFGYAFYDGPEPPRELCERKRLMQGHLEDKLQTTIRATPSPFSANGTAICTITVQPFVPCTLVVDVTPAVLTTQDPSIHLTSNEPHRFRVVLEPTPAVWALPIFVEAT